MSKVRIRLKGLAGVKRQLEAMRKAGTEGIEAGLYQLANEIMTDSKRRVPVDIAVLKGSGYVTKPQKTQRSTRVEIGYGGPAKAYAIVQHEDLSLNHTIGGPKYLERAIDAARPGAAERLRRLIAQALMRKGATLPGAEHPPRPG